MSNDNFLFMKHSNQRFFQTKVLDSIRNETNIYYTYFN
jgi:hypothetical protein